MTNNVVVSLGRYDFQNHPCEMQKVLVRVHLRLLDHLEHFPFSGSS